MYVPEYPKRLVERKQQKDVPNFFNLRADHRTAIYVDGPNVTHSGKLTDRKLDFDALRLLFEQHSDLRFANYYSPIYRNRNFFSIMQRFHEYLAHSRWTVITREGYYLPDGKYRSLDIDPVLCAHLQQTVSSHQLDTILIVSNDGDYVPVIQTCRTNYGVRFLHLSWTTGHGNFIAKPSHNLRLESEISLDLSMPELSEHLLFPVEGEAKPEPKGTTTVMKKILSNHPNQKAEEDAGAPRSPASGHRPSFNLSRKPDIQSPNL